LFVPINLAHDVLINPGKPFIQGDISMRKTFVAVTLATAAFAVPNLAAAQAAAAPAAAPASPHTITGNAGLFSEYRFRGIAQTFGKPAIQGGIDYSHSSGIYVGNWNSNVNEGAGFPAANIEMDLYGGWKNTWGDWGLDIGLIHYMYPGSDANATTGTSAAFTNPRTGATHTGSIKNTEVYIGGSWKWISLKYFHAISNYFSLADTKGSNYWDLSATYDLGGGWGINGHIGALKVRNYSTGARGTDANYTDWKLGVTKDLGGWILGASYIDANAKGSCTVVGGAAEFYCFANQVPNGGAAAPGGVKFKDAGKATIVFSVSKTF
jgi:uncharacterized protein (TIGR02001 family)